MSKHILNELPELLQAKVISEETAENIKRYYQTKQAQSANRLFIVFGILGSLLVGLGIILIIAHNWDELTKSVKLSFALLPLLIGQLACGYSLLKKTPNAVVRESSAVFLVMAIAAGISMVSQIYNIEGSLSGFLFLWMALTLPVIYIMQSSFASMLFIVGITWYACELSYFHYPQKTAWWYWAFIALALPHYFILLKNRSGSNLFYFHSWLIVLSLTIALGTLSEAGENFMLLAYVNLFGFFIGTGQLKPFLQNKLITNAPLIIGSLGTISLLLTMSFEGYWTRINEDPFYGWEGREFYVFIITALLALAALVKSINENTFTKVNLKSFAFIITFIVFVIGLSQPVAAQVLMNILMLVIAVFTIWEGAQQNRLSLLNYGLFILTALIICRFFDIDISYVIRGLLFVIVGAGFFLGNYWMIRKRKNTTTLPS